ncbi:putative MFS family arabinose efflux permease [Kribbella sp. VKM Ac-2527]|uniref:Putative MFS family arabinose efflux permease n=1 Tax=Kribbella caucasensis TaxID=2512215 RepID=A0A4R6JM36_9ACTN|nr:aromatic acid/H+ symport family MFS transporter [Kribbella sp. VKM Ac-2527]TDO36391.1 putative MFS family arabinose efflux permease [Kribbella sp. VKM Ac-2527]
MSTIHEQPGRVWVRPLCWTAVMLDGFDLVVLGSITPILLSGKVFGYTPSTAAAVATAGLVGMMLGALAIGTVTDLIGRRRAMLVAVATFSFFTLLCAFAPSAEVLGLLRLLAGIGLGGCLPTAITLVTEYSRAGRNGGATTLIMTGYHVGAMLTALLGILVIPSLGWRAMFVIGAAPAVVLLPLMWWHLPESPVFKQGAGLDPVKSLLRPGFRRPTIAFWVTTFMGLLLVYGLNTWLPQIMREAGYPLGTALSLLLVLNLGAICGLLCAGRIADRVAIRPVTVAWFAGGAITLALLSVRLPGPLLYVVVLLAGCFVFAAQVLVYAYIGRVYSAENRATGLGWAAGVGRLGAITGPIVGGALLTAGIAFPWGFYVFAVVAALGAIAIGAVERSSVGAPADRRTADRVGSPEALGAPGSTE